MSINGVSGIRKLKGHVVVKEIQLVKMESKETSACVAVLGEVLSRQAPVRLSCPSSVQCFLEGENVTGPTMGPLAPLLPARIAIPSKDVSYVLVLFFTSSRQHTLLPTPEQMLTLSFPTTWGHCRGRSGLLHRFPFALRV